MRQAHVQVYSLGHQVGIEAAMALRRPSLCSKRKSSTKNLNIKINDIHQSSVIVFFCPCQNNMLKQFRLHKYLIQHI